jgi:hypothetical protein
MEDPPMLRDPMISVLETATAFLLMTNALSLVVAVCAMRLLNQYPDAVRAPASIRSRLRVISGSRR